MPRPRRISDSHPELGLPETRKLWQTEGLFSDHYLKKRIRENAWWPTDAEAGPIFEFCKALYEKRYLACAKNNEAFTRQELLDKILEKLGFSFSNNLGLPATQQDLEPDYILYADAETKEHVIDRSREERYRASVAILEAKKLNHALSQISRHQLRYPHQQIRDYLNEAQVLTWGILTNGNEWRLYCRDTKPSHFFAINFELAIQSLENFKFFVAFFRPAAFVRDAQNKCRLDYVRESALAAQSQLEEDLRKRVFRLIEILANGFAERPENKITDADLPRLYENCLIFLYRLLFILYAEGRLLLPVEPKSRKYYKELSVAHRINDLRNFSGYDSRTRARLYEDVRELCHLINGTDEKKNAEYKVPQYNGGLFDPARHPDLEEWRICDAVLADVLRGLMFNPVPERGQAALPAGTVDFGDLRVQQLGSIYEGLMEHHFHREEDSLRLVADKAERRQTGTYYTPDYIVKYIVQNALGPLLAAIDQRKDVNEARTTARKDNSFANAVLELNILDPAMGSGHFLVEVTTHLAEEIASHPTTKPLSEESKDEQEIAHWQRRVVESCIYGIDLNPLAVELAKLSLWLATIAADRPLDFLDHHLCCGNSLIGAQVSDLGQVPDLKRKKGTGLKFTWKLTDNLLAALQKAVHDTKQIEERLSETVADVKSKEKIWVDSVRPALRPFRSVANLWAACFFGNELPQPDYEALLELLDIQPDKIRPWQNATEFQDIVMSAVVKGELKLAGRDFDKNQLKNLCAFLIRAEKAAQEHRFFHWELEFPEVFFNADGTPRETPGFDAVIANPPYDILKRSADKQQTAQIDFLRSCGRYIESLGRTFNLFRPFVVVATKLIHKGGRVGMIIPLSVLNDLSSTNLRRYLLTKWNIPTIEAFPQKDDPNDRVFKEAKLSTCILLIAPRTQIERVKLRIHPGKALLRDSPTIEFALEQLRKFDPIGWGIPVLTKADWRVCSALYSKPTTGSFSEAVECLVGEIDLSLCRPCITKNPHDRIMLKGTQIYRWYTTEELKQGDKEWVNLEKFNELFGNTRKARDVAVPRLAIQGVTGTDDARRLKAAIVDAGIFLGNSADYIRLLPNADYSQLFFSTLLNSTLIEWRFRLTSSNNNVNNYEVDALPLRRIEFSTPRLDRHKQSSKATDLYGKSLPERDANEVLNFVEAELQAGRADVVHDLLGFLAERMIEMNEEKRRIARQFVSDLKDFHGIDGGSMNPKTKLHEFWKLEAVDVFAHFRRNRVRISQSDEEKIRERFFKSKSTIVPLDSQIAFADRLIDQIVYRLYGLTSEEIKIVEQAA